MKESHYEEVPGVAKEASSSYWSDQEIEFQLFVERYQFVELLIKERDAMYESLTYSSPDLGRITEQIQVLVS